MRDIKLGIKPNVGKNVILTDTKLGMYTQIQANCVINKSELGDYTYCAGYNQIDYALIGNFCSIASFVRINPGNHTTFTRVAQHHFTYRCGLFGFGNDDAEFFEWRRSRRVTLGHDVWVGHNACVMPGVTIGSGAVIGAGAVVTREVEPYSIVAGVPARKINMRFSDDLISAIEKTGWWDWDHETLRAGLKEFNDLHTFAEKYSR